MRASICRDATNKSMMIAELYMLGFRGTGHCEGTFPHEPEVLSIV
jgi:hypothetical protein